MKHILIAVLLTIFCSTALSQTECTKHLLLDTLTTAIPELSSVVAPSTKTTTANADGSFLGVRRSIAVTLARSGSTGSIASRTGTFNISNRLFTVTNGSTATPTNVSMMYANTNLNLKQYYALALYFTMNPITSRNNYFYLTLKLYSKGVIESKTILFNQSNTRPYRAEYYVVLPFITSFTSVNLSTIDSVQLAMETNQAGLSYQLEQPTFLCEERTLVPVLYHGFEAVVTPDGVVLQWMVGQPTKKPILVQRKQVNGIYHNIGFGTTTPRGTFLYRDITKPVGTHHYRLSHESEDGQIEYSNVIAVTTTEEKLKLVVTSNAQTISIRTTHNKGRVALEILDVSGRVVSTNNVVQLKRGIYMIKATDAVTTTTQTIFVY